MPGGYPENAKWGVLCDLEQDLRSQFGSNKKVTRNSLMADASEVGGGGTVWG